jgi:hypothetical protein
MRSLVVARKPKLWLTINPYDKRQLPLPSHFSGRTARPQSRVDAFGESLISLASLRVPGLPGDYASGNRLASDPAKPVCSVLPRSCFRLFTISRRDWAIMSDGQTTSIQCSFIRAMI